MVERVEVAIYAVQGNAAVVKLPWRKFPGVLLQGDTLEGVANLLREAREASDADESRAVIDEAQAFLADLLAFFETSLTQADELLPYVKE
jgi:hypothetical protein